MVKLSLEVVLSPFLKIFLQIFFESVLDKISPPFAYMTTYVELLVRYAGLIKMKVTEKILPFTNSRWEKVKSKQFIESLYFLDLDWVVVLSTENNSI